MENQSQDTAVVERTAVQENEFGILNPVEIDFGYSGHDAQAFLERMRGVVDQNEVGPAARTIFNDLAAPRGQIDPQRILNTLYDVHDQGKMPELVQYFQTNYGIDLRQELKNQMPGQSEKIDEAIDNGRPRITAATSQQMQEVFARFPELQGVISSPEVLGAILQNEQDHGYELHKDLAPDLSIQFLSWFNRQFGRGDGTEFVSRMDPQELRRRAENANFVNWARLSLSAWAQENVLRMSVGPAQVQIRNMLALREQERQAGRDVPSLSSTQTTEGSLQLIAAYLVRARNDLSCNRTGEKASDMSNDLTPTQREGLQEAQRLWNTGDPVLRERALLMTYNPGLESPRLTHDRWNAQRILEHYVRRRPSQS